MNTTTRRLATAVAAAGLIALGTAAAPAQAAPTLGPAGAAALAGELGSAGSYRDANGAMVVTVTSDSAAARVRAAGGVAQTVRWSGSDLQSALDRLNRDALIPGTAWSVDPAANQVVVSVDSTVTGNKLSRLTAVTAALGQRVRVESATGTLREYVNGGKAIYGGQYRCTAGFNVRNGSTYYFLTAGHCTNLASVWYQNSAKTNRQGARTGTSFPTNDYGIVKYDAGVGHPGNVFLYGGTQDITTAGNAFVNEQVRRSGSTTGVRSGSVTGLNATVNYVEGTVFGLIKTNVCAESGDSGGPMFDNTIALGLTSGGNGNCTSGGTTYFQPVPEALTAYNVSIY